MKKALYVILIPVLIGVLLYPKLNWIYQQEGDILPVISAVVKLAVRSSDIAVISSSPEKYLIRSQNGIGPVISLMENRGWQYKEQIGSGIEFINNGRLLTATSRMYTKYYTIVLIPDPNQPIAENGSETINLVATGDILMHMPVVNGGKTGDTYNFDKLYAPVKSLIEDGDYASVNMECALAGSAAVYTGYPQFNSPDNIADSLKNSGFDLVVTASNHSLDRGYQGAMRTLDVLRRAGLDTTGTFKTPEEKQQFLIKDIRGVKVGYLAYSYDTNGIPVPADKPYFYNFLDRDKILADIVKIRSQVDVLVLILHWGVEYSPYPTEQQRKLATEFMEKGADVILGSHPHVIQPMEIMKINGQDKFVIYSMGNSMGSQNGVERNSGVIINLQFTKLLSQGTTSLTGLNYTPTYIHPYIVNGHKMYRVVPIEETIKAIQTGNEPYLGKDSLQVLQEVLAATNKTLNTPLQ